MPVLIVVIAPTAMLIAAESIGSLLFLAVLGAIGGVAGGANVWRAMARVTFWGSLALAVTAGIGRLVGTAFDVQSLLLNPLTGRCSSRATRRRFQ
jgi:VIT1/CCC1 family predicted Fe2+/Mn2+ transporter